MKVVVSFQNGEDYELSNVTNVDEMYQERSTEGYNIHRTELAIALYNTDITAYEISKSLKSNVNTVKEIKVFDNDDNLISVYDQYKVFRNVTRSINNSEITVMIYYITEDLVKAI